MLPVSVHGHRGPLLVLLHWLGGGAHTWQRLGVALSARGFRVAAIDAPGFGEAANRPASDVTTAVDALAETIGSLRAQFGEPDWTLGGHSMGGKFAAILARRALDGAPGLEKLRGLVLVSPSPPAPEPINETARAQRVEMFGTSSPDPDKQRAAAERWIADNTGKLPLADDLLQSAVEGVLRNSPHAFRAWFLSGSTEDWSTRVGTVDLPTLVLAGTEETKLGAAAQRKLTLPHFPQAQLVEIGRAHHLTPLERPGELLEHFTMFAAAIGLSLPTEDQAPGHATVELIASERTSARTREAMTRRLRRSLDWNHTPEVFTPAAFHTLRALAEAVVPQAGFDLAACVDAQLQRNKGDGWRYATLPDDPEAWKQGLRSLDAAAERAHGVAFVALYPEQQRALLEQAQRAELGPGLLDRLHLRSGSDLYTAEAMQRWFEDVRAEFTRLYMADPRVMDRLGYTGFADDLGFTAIQLGQKEEFER